MTQWLTGTSDDPTERARRVVAAALRASYAWTVWRERPNAMLEVARMTGVVMEAHGPGRGPTTPVDLIACLRQPLDRLPALAAGMDEEIGRVVLLDRNDQLTPDAYDLASEYALPVGGPSDSTQWMPSWTRMRSDEIRRNTFTTLIEGNGQDAYVASRRFLIEHPAGSLSELRDLISQTGVRPPPRGYTEIPADHLHRPPGGETWWWPCVVCDWPMEVTGTTVRCRYRPHAAVFHLAEGRTATSRPALKRVDEGRPRLAKPVARPAADARCLDFGVWRFVVVPGVSELRVKRRLEELGATVELWPELDRYDLHVRAGDREFRVDLKEYRSGHQLIAALRSEPPRARILLPKTHEYQLETLKTALPALQVTTETKFHTEVRRALRTV
ncbi:restriction endonuclease-related protein [Streptomyces mayteni]